MELDKDFIQIAFYIFLLLNDYFNILSIIFNVNKYFDYAYGKKFRNKFKYPGYSFSKPNSAVIKPPLLGSISKKLPDMCNETYQCSSTRVERQNQTETTFKSCKRNEPSSTSVKDNGNKNGLVVSTKSSSRQNIQKMFLELNKSRSDLDTKRNSSSSSSKNFKKKQQHTLLKMLLQNAEYPWKKIKDKLNFYDTCNGNNCSSNTSNNVKKSRTPFTSHNLRKIEKEDVTSIPLEANYVGHLSNNTGHLLLDKSTPLHCNCEYHQNAVTSEEIKCKRYIKNGLNRRETSLFHKPSQTFDYSKRVKTKPADPARRSNSYPNQKYNEHPAGCNNNPPKHSESFVNISKVKSANRDVNSELLLHKSYKNYLVNPVFVHCNNPQFPNFDNQITLHRTVSNHNLKSFDQTQDNGTITEEKPHTTVNIKINLENKGQSQNSIIYCSQDDLYCNLLVDPSSPLCSHNADKQNGCHLRWYQCQKMAPFHKPASHCDNTTSYHETNNTGVKNVNVTSTQKPERINKMIQNDIHVKKDAYVQNPYRENKNIQTEKSGLMTGNKNTPCSSSRQRIKTNKNIYLVSVNNNRLGAESTSSVRRTSDNGLLSSTNDADKCCYQNLSSQCDNKEQECVECPKLVPYSISSSDDINETEEQVEIIEKLQSQNKPNEITKCDRPYTKLSIDKNIDKNTSKCVDIFYNFENKCNVFQCKVSKTKFVKPKRDTEKTFLNRYNCNRSQLYKDIDKSEMASSLSRISSTQIEENAKVFLNGLEEAPWICIFDGISNFKSGSDTSLNKKCEYTGNNSNNNFRAMLEVTNNGPKTENVENLPIMVLLNSEQNGNTVSNLSLRSTVEEERNQSKYLDVDKCCSIKNKPDMYKNITKNYGAIDNETGHCDIKKGTGTRSRSICSIMDYIKPLNKSVQFSSDYITKDNLKIGYIISRIEDLLNVLNDNIAEKLNNVKKKEHQTTNRNHIPKSFINLTKTMENSDSRTDSVSSWEEPVKSSSKYIDFQKDANNNCNKEESVKKIKTRERNVKQPNSTCNNTVVSLSFYNGAEQKNIDIVQEDTWKTRWLKRLCKNCESNKHLTYPTDSKIEIKNNLRKSTPNKQNSRVLNKDIKNDLWDKCNSTKTFYCNHCGSRWNEKIKIKNITNLKSRNSEYGNSKIMLKKCPKCRKYTYIINKRQPKSARYNVSKKKCVSKTSVTSSSCLNVADNTSCHEIILSMMNPKRQEIQKSTKEDFYNAQYVADLREETFLKMMEPKRRPATRDFPTMQKLTKQVSIMNGLNGHTNGDLNGCDIITQNQQKGCWTIGLINSKFKYLTAETFGFKINANGASLKKKQIWTLEPDLATSGESYIYLKSHLDKYLAVDSFGNVTCENEEKDPGSKFLISVAEDGTGRWAFRNVVRGYFLGASQDKLTCTAKIPGDAEFWLVHLAARPQINLRSVGRKRFAHLSENQEEIYVDANIPWGEDTLFTLEFRADESGKYALHTCNNKYLSLGGKLVDKCSSDCLFTAEYHSGYLALRDKNGSYLSPIGSKAVLKTRSNTVTKDELFSLEDSLPQASFVAALNAKYVSVKQGVDVTANQDEISDHETFQLEFDWSTKRWYIRTMQDRYWTLETGGGIQAAGDKRSSNALFDLIWQGDGSVAFRANNGRYVTTKRSGHLYANSDAVDENSKYFFYLINRPILVLKSEQGFVGYKSGNNTKLECNRAMYETIQVERAEKGVVYFKGQNGKYWHCDNEGVTADSDIPEGFYLELREPTRLSIKSVNGSYLTASKNGVFRLGDSSYENATQWEY